MAKIALYCWDVIGKSMAGPAIRYWEFAKALSKSHEVILATPNACSLESPDFAIMTHREFREEKNLSTTDILLTQQLTHGLALAAKKNKVKIILDAYDPMALENLEVFKFEELKKRNRLNKMDVQVCNFSLSMADAVICANEKQRDLWLGVLMSQNKITPQIYDQDISLKNLIDIVPFGLSSHPPIKNGSGFKEVFNLNEEDKIILWGGGIWNWFDPLSVIQSIKLLRDEGRTEIKLIFMGVKHPNENIEEMKMSRDALQLSKKLGLLDKQVFFNYSWVPYSERQNYLLEADIGISTHFEHLETRFSFRTRLLDYIWSGLPIIATKGDCFASLIEERNLGITVPFQDSSALAQAIKKIIDNPKTKEEMQSNLTELRPTFYWENVVKPIENMVEALAAMPKKKLKMMEMKNILCSMFFEKTPLQLAKAIGMKLKHKFLPLKS